MTKKKEKRKRPSLLEAQIRLGVSADEAERRFEIKVMR